MLSSMIGPLSFAMVLATALMLAAMMAEGRGRHLARLVFGLRSRQSLGDILEDAPREAGDWELVAHVDSTPDRPAPGARAATWVADAGTKASRVVAERASALARPDDAVESTPRSGELGLARQ